MRTPSEWVREVFGGENRALEKAFAAAQQEAHAVGLAAGRAEGRAEATRYLRDRAKARGLFGSLEVVAEELEKLAHPGGGQR